MLQHKVLQYASWALEFNAKRNCLFHFQSHVHGDERCAEDERQDCNNCHAGEVPNRCQDPGGVSVPDSGEMRDSDLRGQVLRGMSPLLSCFAMQHPRISPSAKLFSKIHLHLGMAVLLQLITFRRYPALLYSWNIRHKQLLWVIEIWSLLIWIEIKSYIQ